MVGRAYVGVAAEGLCDGGDDHVGHGGDVDVAEGADRVVDDHGDVVLVGLGGLVCGWQSRKGVDRLTISLSLLKSTLTKMGLLGNSANTYPTFLPATLSPSNQLSNSSITPLPSSHLPKCFIPPSLCSNK